MFSFSHPDPDKIWRLLKRWKSGYDWSSSDFQEFCRLSLEWAKYYVVLGNVSEARKIIKRRESIISQVENRKCKIKKTTSGDVRYALRKSESQPETCL